MIEDLTEHVFLCWRWQKSYFIHFFAWKCPTFPHIFSLLKPFKDLHYIGTVSVRNLFDTVSTGAHSLCYKSVIVDQFINDFESQSAFDALNLEPNRDISVISLW